MQGHGSPFDLFMTPLLQKLETVALSIPEGPGVLDCVCALTCVKSVSIHTRIYNPTVKSRQRYK